MKTKIIFRSSYFIAAAVFVLISSVSMGHAKTYKIKTAHGANISSVRHLTYVNFKELCEKYSDGQLKVDIHPSASLYSDKQSLEACVIGSLQMVFQPDAEVAKILPIGDLIGGPGLYKDLDAFYKFSKSPEILQVLEPLKSKMLQPIGHNLNSAGYVYMSNVRPIRKPSDLSGVKIRSWPAEFPRKMIESVGGNPVIISLSEVTTALQQGAVEGVFTSFVTGYAAKLNELTKYYCTGILLGPSPNIAVFNKAFWDHLPKNLRDIITEKVWPENLAYNYKIVMESEKKAREAYSASGDLYILDDAPNADEWMKTVVPVRDYYIEKVSKEEWGLVKKGIGIK